MSSATACSFSLRLECGHNATHRGRKPLVGDPWWCSFGHFSVIVSGVWETTRSGGPLMASSNQSPVENDTPPSDDELPGVWSHADFTGGREEVRGPDWVPDSGSTPPPGEQT